VSTIDVLQHPPVVFTGPSLSRQEARRLLPGASVLPPVARGDLYRERERGSRLFLIIDGSFAHKFAVSPGEVVDVLADGATIMGASSIGAVRAAECWPAGMIGTGAIYRLYRLGVLESDDEVAVATDPERDFTAVSLALITVRFAIHGLLRTATMARGDAQAILDAAKGTFFAERVWPTILGRAGLDTTQQDEVLALVSAAPDIKRRDAVSALNHFARLVTENGTASAEGQGRRPRRRGERYVGHDRYLGYPVDVLKRALITWLFGSGRYQRYLWPLVIGEPEFRALEGRAEHRPELLREQLADALARLLRELDRVADRLWFELEFLDELDAELMRWHAVDQLASAMSDAQRTARVTLERVRERVAIAHGYADWRSLTDDVQDGRLFGAIPAEWVEAACQKTATAEAFGTVQSELRCW
jgi:hypothetical protein